MTTLFFLGAPAIAVLSLAFVFPPYAIALSLLLSPGEALGTARFVSSYVPLWNYIISVAVLIAAAQSIYRLSLRRHLSEANNRIFQLTRVVILAAAWVTISIFASGVRLHQACLSADVLRLLSMTVVFAYWDTRRARILFVWVVLIHVILGAILVLWPTGLLSELEAAHLIDADNPDLAGGLGVLQIRRDGGQFANGIQLAYYGALGLLIIFNMIVSKKKDILTLVLLGLPLAITGAIIQYTTVTRGIWLGLMFCVAIKALSKRLKRKAVFVAIGLLLLLMQLLAIGGTRIPLPRGIDRFGQLGDDMSRESYRFTAIQIAISEFAHFRIFGCGSFEKTVSACDGYVPHQAPLYFGVMYGIPAGIILLLLIFLSVSESFLDDTRFAAIGNENKEIKTRIDKELIRSFGWITFFLAMTNGMAGAMMMWVTLGVACLPWAFRKRAKKERRKRHTLAEMEA